MSDLQLQNKKSHETLLQMRKMRHEVRSSLSLDWKLCWRKKSRPILVFIILPYDAGCLYFFNCNLTIILSFIARCICLITNFKTEATEPNSGPIQFSQSSCSFTFYLPDLFYAFIAICCWQIQQQTK